MRFIEKINFKISGGGMSPEPPSVPAPSVLYPISAGPTRIASAVPVCGYVVWQLLSELVGYVHRV